MVPTESPTSFGAAPGAYLARITKSTMTQNNTNDKNLSGDQQTLWRVVIPLLYFLAAISALIYTRDSLRYFDEFQYISLAKNLVTRGIYSIDGAHLSAYRAPGWPAVMAVLWWVWPSVLLVKIFNLVCWALTGLLVSRIARNFWGVSAGRIAAILYLCYVVELYTATTLYPQVLAALLTVCVFLIATSDGRHGIARQAGMAVLSAMQLMIIPNCIAVTVPVYSYMIFARKISFRGAAVAGLVVVAAMGLWCVRNEGAIGKFTFGTNVGINLLYGNHSGATAAAGVMANIRKYTDSAADMSEVQSDEFFTRSASAWISKHPLSALRLFGEKFIYWFAYENSYETRVPSHMIALVSKEIFIIYYSVLVAAAMAIFLNKGPVGRIVILTWLINLLAAVSYAVFFTRLRFRLPFDPLLFSVAAGAITELARRYWQPDGRVHAESQ